MEQPELRSLFDGYMDCFDRLDGPAAATYYSAPSFVVKNGGITRFGPDEKSDHFSALMCSNAEVGEHVWEIADFDVDLPVPNGAIATVRWIARRPDRSPAPFNASNNNPLTQRGFDMCGGWSAPHRGRESAPSFC